MNKNALQWDIYLRLKNNMSLSKSDILDLINCNKRLLITGNVGSGKTYLAKELKKHISNLNVFDTHSWNKDCQMVCSFNKSILNTKKYIIIIPGQNKTEAIKNFQNQYNFNISNYIDYIINVSYNQYILEIK